MNAQELISSKLAGLLDDSRQKHGGDDDEELSSVAVDAVGSAAASPRAVRGTASATRHRIAGVCAHIIAAAAAAFGVGGVQVYWCCCVECDTQVQRVHV